MRPGEIENHRDTQKKREQILRGKSERAMEVGSDRRKRKLEEQRQMTEKRVRRRKERVNRVRQWSVLVVWDQAGFKSQQGVTLNDTHLL